jgi:hypothetical protein
MTRNVGKFYIQSYLRVQTPVGTRLGHRQAILTGISILFRVRDIFNFFDILFRMFCQIDHLVVFLFQFFIV